MASMVTSHLAARKSKRYQGVLPAFTQINRNLITWMYDGEVVLFVPRQYSIDACPVGVSDAEQGIPRLNLVDDGAGGGAGRRRQGRRVRRCSLSGLRDQKLLADSNMGVGEFIPCHQCCYGNLEAGSDLYKRVALANDV